MFFRNIYFECKWMSDEVAILIKHPSRKESWSDLKYHWKKLWGHIIFHPWYCLKRGVKNLYTWFPIIWRTDVYDHSYLLDIMDQQMKDMEEFFFSEHTWAISSKRTAKQIRWTRRLLELWRTEHYTMLEYDKHKLKFPDAIKGILESEPCAFDEYGIPTLYKCKELPEDDLVDFKNHIAIGRKMEEKCKKLLFKNLAKIDRWWD